MAENSFLNPDVQNELSEIKEADIVVGIPSYNNVGTISQVVRAVNAGLVKYFPKEKSVLINSDGGSSDGTQEKVLNTSMDDLSTILVSHPLYPVHKIVTPYHGIPGKGSAFRTIFKIAESLNAKACAVVDSDLRSITPEWIELLIAPILKEGFDYVAPLYSRHKFDGTITNSIVYPLTRALYGKQIRQPIGGDFGFSGEVAKFYLTKDVWDTDVAKFGIDIWMTITAVSNGYNICQSYLGAKIHDKKDPGQDLSAMFTQVVSTIFTLMIDNYAVWPQIRNTVKVPVFGFHYEVGTDPVRVNIERMVNIFKQGLNDLEPILETIVDKEILEDLRSLTKYNANDFHFHDDLWVKVVYNYAVAHFKAVINRDHILKSMIPLYLGRTASFVIENLDSEAQEVEDKIEKLCQRFEDLKPYLLDKWIGKN